MKCRSCGREVDEKSKFCVYCAASLLDSSRARFCSNCGAETTDGSGICEACARAQNVGEEERVCTQENFAITHVGTQRQDNEKAECRKDAVIGAEIKSKGSGALQGKRTALIIVLGVIALLTFTILTVSSAFLKGREKGAICSESNSFNMVNGSNIISRDDDIFFTRNSYDYTLEYNIYSMKKDGSGIKKLYSGERLGSLYCYADSLFFRKGTDICKMDMKTMAVEKILGESSGLYGHDDKIFFCSGYYDLLIKQSVGSYKLCSFDIKTGSIAEISDDKADWPVFTGDFIYYHNPDDNTIYRCDYSGQNKEGVWNLPQGAQLTKFYVYGDKIFFNEYPLAKSKGDKADGIWSFSIKNKEMQRVTNEKCYSMVLYDGDIIYCGAEGVKRCGLNGDGIRQLFSAGKAPLFLIDGVVYCKSQSRDGDLTQENYTKIDLTNGEAENVLAATLKETVIIDKYIFFINEKDDYLYRADKNGSNIVTAVDARVDKLYSGGGRLLYLGFASKSALNKQNKAFDNCYGLYELDTDTTDATLIAKDGYENSDKVGNVRKFFENVAVSDKYVAYSELVIYDHGFNEIICHVLKRDETSHVYHEIPWRYNWYASVACMDNGWIYSGGMRIPIEMTESYSSTANIFRFKADQPEEEDISQINGTRLKLDGRWLFYIDISKDSTLWRIDLMQNQHSHRESIQISTEKVLNYAVADNFVCYVTEDDELYAVMSDGQRRKLADIKASSMVVSGGEIYYTNEYGRGSIEKRSIEGKGKGVVINVDFDAPKSVEHMVYGL